LLYGQVEGRALTDDEIAGAIRILTLGGFGTTTDAISATTLKLIEDPDLQARLRRDPALIPRVFDEVLRIEPPVISMPRICTQDVQVGDQTIRAGDEVLLHFGAANRDPDEFDHPGTMDMDRPRNRHLSFGGGPHRCIGSNLARLNLRVVFEEILSRMDDIQLSETESSRHNPAWFAWGLQYLPITFTPGKRVHS
jgi:cytochrome P450